MENSRLCKFCLKGKEGKGRGRNNFLKLALIFRLDLFDLKIQNHRNSLAYFEDFVFEDRSKMALR